MNTMEARLPRWLDACAPAVNVVSANKTGPDSMAKALQLSGDDSARFLRIVSECAAIRRHYDLYRWLGAEVQHFLPHEVLFSAWGHFGNWDLKLDVTSGIPGVRTTQLAQCRMEQLVRQAYARWIDASRQPVLLKTSDIEALRSGCSCDIHAAFRGMRSVLVHGVHDKRSGHDSLYIALTAGSFTKGRSVQRFCAFLDPLVAQIDSAFRRIPAFAGAEQRRPAEGCNVLDLSAREIQVLDSMCRGRTNLEIAAGLDISPFTVKNHVQRIFRKIGVTNRTQASARYSEALRQAAGAQGNAPDQALAKTV